MSNNIFKESVFELIYVIVNFGMGSKILHKAKEYGLKGGTILLGKGTINNGLLNFLSLYDERKEIVLMAADREKAFNTLDLLDEKFHFEKPNHGIAFTISACGIEGSRCYKCEELKEKDEVKETMYQMITVIVNKGRAEDVIDAATKAGSKGGTIINARGSGIHEHSKLFNIEIEPEKEVVIILSKKETTCDIVSSIREGLALDEPGNGILFVQNVNTIHGLYE
ncbi:MAG: P-II family nitrogen regulator [Clostridiales bacterium]|nr:P-II family nitrogen regulator [Clostridiales bacterium]